MELEFTLFCGRYLELAETNQPPLCKGIPLLREMSRRDKGFAVFARKAVARKLEEWQFTLKERLRDCYGTHLFDTSFLFDIWCRERTLFVPLFIDNFYLIVHILYREHNLPWQSLCFAYAKHLPLHKGDWRICTNLR